MFLHLSVSHSVHRGVSQHAMGQTHPPDQRQTPPRDQKQTPRTKSRHPRDQKQTHPPPTKGRRLLLRTVCILLECILVLFTFFLENCIKLEKQECIPVGCIPAERWPYSENWRPPPPKIWSRHPPRKFGAPPRIRPDTHAPPLWTEFLTHACENITLAKTSFRPVNIGPKRRESAHPYCHPTPGSDHA